MITVRVASASLDLSFLHYVERRKRQAAARVREGEVYAFGGDLRFRHRLAKLRPVVLAIEAAQRHFQHEGRRRLLADAVAVDRERFSAVAADVSRAAEALGIAPPETFVAASTLVHDLLALGPVESPVLIVPGALLDRLDAGERLALFGQGCGRIHNQHTPLSTALFFLESTDSLVGRWAALPATMALSSWAERAAVTADRASLLVTRDFGAVARSLVKRLASLKQLAGEIDPGVVLAAIEAGAAEPPEGQGIEPAQWRQLAARLAALRTFERTTFYRGGLAAPPTLSEGETALSLEACEIAVAKIMSGVT